MKLDFIPLDKLCVSKTNMRYAKRAPDVTDILPSVRKRGVIQPVVVRPNCEPGAFEIVAGARRFTAARIVADERAAAGEAGPPEPLPCAILDSSDDADARVSTGIASRPFFCPRRGEKVGGRKG